jgi:hypothetical protein
MYKLFFLLLTLSGCSFFIAKIDAPLVKDTYQKDVSAIQTYCPMEKSYPYLMVGTNVEAQNVYMKSLQPLETQLDILDHLALWSLIQLQVRPDQSSPTARMQLILNLEGTTHYFDFFSESHDNQYPYLYGIEWILKKFNKKTTLESYAHMLEKYFTKRLPISKDFATFLALQKEDIKKIPELNASYIRGPEILREGESFPAFKTSDVIKEYRKHFNDQKIVVNTSLTPYNTPDGHLADCNYDFNLYDNSIFLIDKTIPSANLFGLAHGKSAFLTSSSQKVLPIIPLLGLPLFKGESKIRSSALCVIEDRGEKIWAFSNQSRDPGQHLFHLIRYGLPHAHTTQEVDKLIKHSRHLFLSEPVRLVIESNRSRQDQVENLLKLNLPIYNADNLGNIWAYTFFQNTPRFIIDDRNSGNYLCK